MIDLRRNKVTDPTPPPQTPSPPSAVDPLELKLASLPTQPGCYVFRDRAGAVLYVGKAKSLRARVRSYFQAQSGDTRAFIPFLREEVGDFETIVAATEKEATILENHLIKERKPRYNVKLRDDKEYLSLRISSEHEWPRLELVRRPERDGARYFGPYHSATAARRTLNVVEKHFKLRTCTDRELSSRKRPCLEYQIKRCPGPCVYEVDRAAYAAQVRAVALFLDGRHDELVRELEERMREASSRMEFELAAAYRDQLQAVQQVRQAQRVAAVTDRDQDVLGIYREGDLVELTLMVVRGGRVIDVGSFSNRRVEVPDDEVMASFLREHYGEGGGGEALIPDEILLPALPEGVDGVREWLDERRQALAKERGERAPRRIEIMLPMRGPRRALLDLALQNAEHAFKEKRRTADDIEERLLKVQARLRLPSVPHRIECVDISHHGGSDTVGAVVALADGTPDKKRYRTYHVRGVAEGDDYGAIYQVLSRRFRRGLKAQDTSSEAEDETAWDLPDLFVVDGGRGQLGVALAAAHDLGLHTLPIVGLAKERESLTGDKQVDRVYLPGQKNPIPLRPNSPELFMLARARDEAHRFSNRGRKKAGRRRTWSSRLEDVPGIGPKTRKALLRHFPSVQAIFEATEEQLREVPTLTRKHITALLAARAEPPNISGEPDLDGGDTELEDAELGDLDVEEETPAEDADGVEPPEPEPLSNARDVLGTGN
ncbi:MAG TPA: excinuclease ABC subunit UvrC [Polyangiaceae bacterium]|nr:excinuclease ABC subunit UvrC [Polyangiaceae bacterium]